MRDIDHLIEYVRNCPYIRGAVQKQVIINRLDVYPTEEELERARSQVYGGADSFLESVTVAETRNSQGVSLLDSDTKTIERDGK